MTTNQVLAGVGSILGIGSRAARRDALLPGSALLFLVRRDGRLDPDTGGSTPLPRPGDTAVLPAPGRRGSKNPAR
ncbi:hypothetical protein [Streptomyces sp. NPDC056105]|uniref:hypothetical protein n=1 Tax=Streptomyces sp. NPDC056105 TaxID=3345714 RepID=UPI0035DF84B5